MTDRKSERKEAEKTKAKEKEMGVKRHEGWTLAFGLLNHCVDAIFSPATRSNQAGRREMILSP